MPGNDYVLSGYKWSNPGHITYSIAPDGVLWDHGVNDLNAVFNAKFGTDGAWQAAIARALATWESVANINIVPTTDGPYSEDVFGYSQGDARFGDIRLGGYSFPGKSSTLAQTYFPPPNGSTAAGDVEVNTSMNFGMGSDYDFYSVILHELGHSLGLDHAKNPADVMYANYQGVRTGLAEGDIAGIQAIYGARTLDAYQAKGQGLGYSSAIDVSAGLAGANSLGLSNLSLAAIGDAEYFTFTAPSYASGVIRVTASAANVSMLSPEVRLYDAAGNLLASASNPAAWSDGVTAEAASVVPGQKYYAVVSGATGDVFSVGSYNLTVALPASAPPPPSTPTPPASPGSGTSGSSGITPTSTTSPSPDRLEPNDTPGAATGLGRLTHVTVGGLTLSSAADVDDFTFRVGSSGRYLVGAAGVKIQVYNARGRLIAGGTDAVNLPPSRAGTPFLVRISSATGAPVSAYSLTVSTVSPFAARRTVRTVRHQLTDLAAVTGASASAAKSRPAPISTPVRELAVRVALGFRAGMLRGHLTGLARRRPPGGG
ncbi:matrixin family metalloprotease [Aquisphaera giovannonii]|uniref:matrixin family metalloprotease n=1 Tax=Aquisphaera giovannonii TaxID=406548 RepID=UPI00143D71A7|nr:matrixin family metalloprotease [Aquisphaera giovannonii]